MTQFAEMSSPTPDIEALESQYQVLLDDLAGGAEQTSVVSRWDRLRKTFSTWGALTHVRYTLDTKNAENRAAKELLDELSPRVESLDSRVKATLLEADHKGSLSSDHGDHLAALWGADLASFDPVISDDLVTESKLRNRYVELLASAQLEFRGETHNLSTIPRYTLDPDRNIRREATAVQWAFFQENGDELDTIFDEMVKLRTSMARKLGYENFIELGYQRMQRVDYDRDDVRVFRDQVLNEVVPLVSRLRALQADRLEVGSLKAWDMATYSQEGNPRPIGDHDWMLERATEMFDEMGPRFSSFFRMMKDSGLLELESRDGKAGGGYCSYFFDYEVPFIFANFNGTQQDVRVFTHECGHAFQGWSSREAAISDYVWPTYESAEIHSMSLEFLCWPHMDKFFGEEGERFCWTHLAGALDFLPYGVAVDEFQHRIYEQPDAHPAERHAIWHDCERRYQPELDWDDLGYPAKGGRWQLQRHIYLNPFYYIDYTLAQTCALQFWLASRKDRDETLSRYHKLCSLGGTGAFQQLVSQAGLRSPFAEGCLSEVLEEAASVLFGS
ncbi:MAG TPA: peptidase M3 [Deltaproteobacteria bacterium]|nr:peptidase M3 [Deltaproteobacteria bacterium]HCP45654.1 peptidase M3 [Deltaproteobacteria bacterium]